MTTSQSSIVVGKSTWHSLDDLTRADKDNNVTLGVSAATVDPLSDINTLLWKIIPAPLLGFGTFGNVMTVVVMRGMRSSHSTACLSLYFTALAVSDQIQLMVSAIYFWGDMGFSWPQSFFRFDLLCSVPQFTWNATGITSAWFLVAMTYQRVVSVVAPHRVGVLCTMRRGKVIVAIISFVGCALNVHFLFTWFYLKENRKCYFRKQYLHLMEFFEWEQYSSLVRC
ncbi:neuromedin U receptor homolog nmur-2-like [Babylonia areolata]|uniref:neuromedin U receptor homolog nmur-2-like n=1 Tax=Babylonia areolata TaxID=304850 RepID=UPI003FD620F0